MISNPVQGICHPRVGIDICLFAPLELANKKFFLHLQRQWSYLVLNGILIQMDSTIFKEGFYSGKLVYGIVQCPANGSLDCPYYPFYLKNFLNKLF